MNTKTQFLIERLKKFQYNNKSSKYLAKIIKQNRDSATLTVIKDSVDTPIHDSKDINDVLRNFYKRLYTSDRKPNTDDIHKLLYLPHLTQEQVNKLETIHITNCLRRCLRVDITKCHSIQQDQARMYVLSMPLCYIHRTSSSCNTAKW